MKRAHSSELKPFRRTLKPRPRQWLRHWLRSLAMGLLIMVFVEWNSLRSSQLIGAVLVVAALMATLDVFGELYREWKGQPRRLQFWSDDTPAGTVVRHLYSGEILFHTSQGALGADDLRGICLDCADLRGERMQGIDLRGARLRGANLEYASLESSSLQGADLVGSRLAGASLKGANLKGADLRGADLCGRGVTRALSGGCLDGAILFGAVYNAATRWPPGFDPAAQGCAYENDAEQALPIPAAGAGVVGANLPVSSQMAVAETAVWETVSVSNRS